MTEASVTRNKVVSIRYQLRDEEGEIVEIHDLPVSYVHGSGADLFPAIEQALDGKKIGDQVSVRLTPAEAFGPHDPKLTFTDDLENVPPELRTLGKEFEAENAKGEPMLLRVTEIKQGTLTVDANHPLAGQTITFEVTVAAIRDATPEEIRDGRPDFAFSPLQ